MAKAASRSVPTVGRVLRALGGTGLPRPAVSSVVRRELAALRSEKKASAFANVLSNVRNALADLSRARIHPAINGTGIIVPVHSNGSAAETAAVRALLKVPKDDLRKRAEKLKLALEAMPMKTSIGTGKSLARGGTLPRSTVSSVTLDLLPLTVSLPEFAARLRAGTPPIIGYLAGGRFKLDVRTVFPNQDERLFRAIYKVFGI